MNFKTLFCAEGLIARNLNIDKMTKDEFITERTRIISEMLDNPNELEIYPTTKCFEQLDELFDKIIADEETRMLSEVDKCSDELQKTAEK